MNKRRRYKAKRRQQVRKARERYRAQAMQAALDLRSVEHYLFERRRYDDDGRDYADPRDYKAGRE